MKVVVLLALLLLTLTLVVVDSAKYIIGGNVVTQKQIEKYSAAAWLENTNRNKLKCGVTWFYRPGTSSLEQYRYALTTSDCISNTNKQNFRVHLRDRSITDPSDQPCEESVGIQELAYVGGTDNNLIVLKLDSIPSQACRTAHFPICAPFTSSNPAAKIFPKTGTARVAGWGKTEPNSNLPGSTDLLRQAKLTFFRNYRKCNSGQGLNNVQRFHMCAKSTTTSYAGGWLGDSGDPLLLMNTVSDPEILGVFHLRPNVENPSSLWSAFIRLDANRCSKLSDAIKSLS